ncbi:hypothetical protein SAMN05443572_116144 [Myxococcus fulvus]|uniref:Uncharacterized protein n=1 Tax=Myxococcus fulvus TaxID=33 RepID=A0A511TGH1_MYXFU|nr:hypothetical protein [Myxococcus fulvus]AKF84372.1 hypothetical protein MFUL124B02_42380 [Myxococcus fulvus 124B02]GEN13260.1 hypothetical protein MFU01_82970 [Myxococcus fulvus]SEU41265.1 hypothetical protein SAMN05443572_116144 [Myxococcus fulvus]
MGNKGSGKTPSANDQRSVSKNPNNPAHKSSQDNRANQMNKEHAPSKGPGNTIPGGAPGSGQPGSNPPKH